MKLSTLISVRTALLRRAHLANLALAYETLRGFARRIERARLTGRVVLQPAAPEAGRFCATLTAIEGSQSVLEEHFSDEDLMELGDVLGFTLGERSGAPREIAFRLENFAESFLAPLRAELVEAGVAIDAHPLQEG
jgi:hypothetical protein